MEIRFKPIIGLFPYFKVFPEVWCKVCGTTWCPSDGEFDRFTAMLLAHYEGCAKGDLLGDE